jgi:hypothetical protein
MIYCKYMIICIYKCTIDIEHYINIYIYINPTHVIRLIRWDLQLLLNSTGRVRYWSLFKHQTIRKLLCPGTNWFCLWCIPMYTCTYIIYISLWIQYLRSVWGLRLEPSSLQVPSKCVDPWVYANITCGWSDHPMSGSFFRSLGCQGSHE